MARIGHGEIAIVAPLSGGLANRLRERYGAVDGLERADPARIRVLVASGSHGVDAATIAALPALGLIAVFGVGYDRVDIAAARARGIVVANTPDVLTDDTADLAVALLYAAARRIAANDAFVRAGHWADGRPVPFGRRLSGRRFGIVGLGRIGGAVARRLRPIAGTIAYHNRRPVPDTDLTYHDTVEALAAASDALVVCAAVRPGDPPLVTRAVLDALGPDGILVNVARGAAVDDAALAAALADRRILAAGLDVFADEPHVPSALLAVDTVVLSPHTGSATPETRAAMADRVLANIAAFDRGEAPGDVVS